MRPLDLQIRGIGPFAGEENIPFDRLGDGGLYLITGDTGAGKTTIFDAICFALFGEVSGDVRESATLRSDYAVPEQESRVTFRFLQNGKEYVVTRNPAYERKKLRGQGMAKQLASAQLTLPDGTIVDGEREVTRRIEGILGLDRSQFKQTSMIAQGEFLKLLLADTKKRSDIFRKIFGTGLYSNLQDRLRQEAGEWKKRCEETERSIRQYLDGIQLEPEGQENCHQTESLRSILGAAGLDEAEQVPELLTGWLTLQKERLSQLETEAAQLEQLSHTVTEALTRVRQENSQKRQLAAEQQRYDVHIKEEAAQQQEQQFLDRADRVEQICKPLWQRRQDAAAQLIRQRDLLQEKRLKKEKLDEKLPALKAARDQSVQQESERQQMREQLAARRAELPGRKAAWQELQQLMAQKETAEKSVTQNQEAFLVLEEKYSQKNTAYMEIQRAFLRQQAGVLAGRLKAGEPCPVCGSTEHPAPADRSGEIVEEAQVQKAQEEMTAAQEALQQLGLTLRSQRTLAEQLTQRCADAEAKLDGWDQHRIQAEERVIRQEEQQLKAQEQQAQQNIRAYEDCQKELLPLEGELENQAGQVRAAEVALQEAEAAWLAGLKQEQLVDEADYASYILKASDKKRRKDACQAYRETGVKLMGSLQKLQEFVEEAERIRLESGYEALLRRTVTVEAVGQAVEDFAQMSSQEMESALQEKSRALADSRTQAERVRSSLRQQITSNERIAAQLQKQMTKRQQQITKWELYADLDRTAGGNLKGQERLALEQYVQAFYFDQIVERANRRFREMSGGRYQLGRKQEASSRRSMAGLELEVMDYYTGKRRPVGSLSGGEAFQASLSLALGMSDVVQSMAGGIHIEAMFVDEGFGSLDREAMDLAVNMLKGLAEEHFLVGIISHVEELKDRIEQKILVEKGTSGSHVRVQL